MVAFSCCEYDFGEAEKLEMDMARERGWKGKFRKRGRVIRPGANRIDGKCPLTPLEVSLINCLTSPRFLKILNPVYPVTKSKFTFKDIELTHFW